MGLAAGASAERKMTLCPICTSESKTPAIQDFISPYNEEKYQLHHCDNCRLEYWTPLQIIPEFYTSEGYEAYAGYHSGSRPFPRWTLPFFDCLPAKTGTLLDIGCGDGAFLAKARETGFEVYGIDLDSNSIEAAKKKFNLSTLSTASINDFSNDAKRNNQKFDVITFFEVLEHQDNPLQFIGLVKSLLKPGGWLAGSVPNRARFMAKFDRKFNNGDLPPHHFLWFSPDVLRYFLAHAGFESISLHESGNTPFPELNSKVSALLARRFSGQPHPLLEKILRLASVPITSGISLGYFLKPSHIYFHATWRQV
jgi:2-polyprenyl-3-methyl-5-hydroxy-6-metoxy-1,4-benzoquinol methylase